MNTAAFLCRPWVCCTIVIWSLGLLHVAVLGKDAGGPVAKRDAKGPAKLVDAIVNRNKPPKLVGRPRYSMPGVVALYPESYDWKEEERVRQAIDKLHRDRTAALWEELVRREDDPRYCVVIMTEKRMDAEIHTVGDICAGLAYERLVGVFERHMPPEGPDFRPLSLDLDAITDLAAWRKKRANKPLYQLQIEVGRMALRELSKLKGVPKKEINLAQKAIAAEIKKLRRIKQPILRNEPFNHDYLYKEITADRVWEAVRTGSTKDLDIP